MKTLFSIADFCLHQNDIVATLKTTHRAKALLNQGQLSFCSEGDILPISAIRFPDRPVLLMPKAMPKRKMNSVEGQMAFFHALAHIELIAVYLAWDIVYRFRGLPDTFYSDWLNIADEEAQHFELIRSHLLTMGIDYGDLPAHRGLWEHAEDTAEDLLARLAIIPRCMEARGLDVTPTMIDKFTLQGDEASVALLTRILNDEIGHVKTGSYWFAFFCQQQGLDSEQTFQQLIRKYYVGKPKGPFNRELRIIAGFSDAEINWLEGAHE